MAYFQNPFPEDWHGNLPSDAKHSRDFYIPANRNKSDLMISWNVGPYDLSSDDTLTINYALDRGIFKNWCAVSVTVSGSTASATTAQEVADALNNDTAFAQQFTAEAVLFRGPVPQLTPTFYVAIRTIRPREAISAYISNTSAEKKLKFNKYAGVADLPTYFNRHTIANRWTYNDSHGRLVALTHDITAISLASPGVVTSAGHGLSNGDTIYLVNTNSDPVLDGSRTVANVTANTFTVGVNTSAAGTKGSWMTAVEYQIITDYELVYSDMKEDYELLGGRFGPEYVFKNQTVNSDDQVTEIIEYPAGAVAGDLARKTQMTYNQTADINPATIIQIPYVLQSGDLIYPT